MKHCKTKSEALQNSAWLMVAQKMEVMAGDCAEPAIRLPGKGSGEDNFPGKI